MKKKSQWDESLKEQEMHGILFHVDNPITINQGDYKFPDPEHLCWGWSVEVEVTEIQSRLIVLVDAPIVYIWKSAYCGWGIKSKWELGTRGVYEGSS